MGKGGGGHLPSAALFAPDPLREVWAFDERIAVALGVHHRSVSITLLLGHWEGLIPTQQDAEVPQSGFAVTRRTGDEFQVWGFVANGVAFVAHCNVHQHTGDLPFGGIARFPRSRCANAPARSALRVHPSTHAQVQVAAQGVAADDLGGNVVGIGMGPLLSAGKSFGLGPHMLTVPSQLTAAGSLAFSALSRNRRTAVDADHVVSSGWMSICVFEDIPERAVVQRAMATSCDA